MTSTNQALASYRAVGAVAKVAAADDPVKLIQLLMDGAVDRLNLARGHLARGEVGPKGEQLARAVAIVDTLNGLVDVERGGDVARNLRALYDYALRRMTDANLHNDVRALDDATAVMRELKTGWDGLARQPRAPVGATP